MTGKSKRGLPATKTRSTPMNKEKSAASEARITAKNPPPAPRVKGEKSVRATHSTIGLQPLKLTREAKRPLDPRAVDRRKQILKAPASSGDQ